MTISEPEERLKRMTINVTQEDINKGVRNSCTKCPVALAVHRALNKMVRVGFSGVRVEFSIGVLQFLRIPQECQDFMARFDFGMPVQPFEFEI